MHRQLTFVRPVRLLSDSFSEEASSVIFSCFWTTLHQPVPNTLHSPPSNGQDRQQYWYLAARLILTHSSLPSCHGWLLRNSPQSRLSWKLLSLMGIGTIFPLTTTDWIQSIATSSHLDRNSQMSCIDSQMGSLSTSSPCLYSRLFGCQWFDPLSECVVHYVHRVD